MKTIMATLACLISISAYARSFSENHFDYSPDYVSESAITEKDFQTIAQAINRIYEPKIQALGYKFEVVASWSSPTLNARAEEVGKKKSVILHGAFARLKYMSFDTYLTLVCHEVGHHIGGFPRRDKTLWNSSAEGQADYFATLKCFREILKKTPEILSRKVAITIPKEAKSLCRSQFAKDLDYNICLRGAQAALNFGLMANAYEYPGQDLDISLTRTTPPLRGSTKTIHSDPQCRVETLFQGSLCNVDESVPLSFSNELQGTCHKLNGHRIGLRPQCWFVPRN